MSAPGVARTLEVLLAGVACELGEHDDKKLQKWRHLYRDQAALVVGKHYSEGKPYALELFTIANDVKNKIESMYKK